jgi:hypothetical protein
MECMAMMSVTGMYASQLHYISFHIITLHCIALHPLDPELDKMTVGCGICHINAKTYVQYIEVFTQENSGFTLGY